MSRAKPTLGYPSRTDAVMALRANGLTNRQVAARIGINESATAALFHSGSRKQSPALRLPPWLWMQLVDEAAGRSVRPLELAFRVIEFALKDDLIDAILDDHPAAGRKSDGASRGVARPRGGPASGSERSGP